MIAEVVRGIGYRSVGLVVNVYGYSKVTLVRITRRHTMTNYERIVNMTIDELADYLENRCRGFESCPTCPFCDDCPEDYKITFADWLKKEVKHHD